MYSDCTNTGNAGLLFETNQINEENEITNLRKKSYVFSTLFSITRSLLILANFKFYFFILMFTRKINFSIFSFKV